MVEADYRMKLIGIGLERPPVRMVSYVDRAKPGEISRNALQRWFFVPDYKCVRQSDDKLAMELVGDGVKLVGEDEMVTASGQRRTAAGRGNKASQAFRRQLHQALSRTGRAVAGLCRIAEPDRLGRSPRPTSSSRTTTTKADWKMPFFGSEQEFPVEIYDIPKTVETAVNAIWKGHTLMTPIGGGVTDQATQALKDDNLLADEEGQGGQDSAKASSPTWPRASGGGTKPNPLPPRS